MHTYMCNLSNRPSSSVVRYKQNYKQKANRINITRITFVTDGHAI